MKKRLPVRFIYSLVIFIGSFLFSISTYAQQWTFATHFGGTAAGFSDAIKAICTDASGNVYATGNFNATINFGNGTGTLTATAGGTATDGFVAKFNAAGLCQWSIRFGGAATDLGGLGIVTNGTTVYVTGQSQFPATVGASGSVTTVGGGTDGIVFALDAATGSTAWVKAFGGGATTDMGQSICLDGAGNVYISGFFATRTSNPVAWFGAVGSFPRTVQGSMTQATTDLFVAQLNPATGVFNWVSAGGAASQETPSLIIGNDNITASGLTYIPATNQLVMVGSFGNANANYFSNGSSTSSVSLTNTGQSDICILRLSTTGNFISGISAGGTSADEALAVTYDNTTAACYITGYYNSASISGAINLTNSAGGFDEIFYARYDPSANTITWANHASGSVNGSDVGFATASNAGNVYFTGRYQGNISFPNGASPLTASSSGADDVFLLKVNAATGNATELGIGNGSTGTDAGLAVATSTSNNIWVGGIFAGPVLSLTPSSPSVSVSITLDQELFLAKYNDPPPTVTTQPTPSSSCEGLSNSFTVIGGGTGLTYQWQESADALFTTPTTLTNTGIYSTATTATLNISNNTTVNGKYYRAIINNIGGSVTSNGAQLIATTPTLPSSNSLVTQSVNTLNNLYYAASCAEIAKVIPLAGAPVSGNVTAQVWIEGGVPTFASQPFVARHYQLIPTINVPGATATITLYFSQAEFDAFNAATGSVADLPTGTLDNTGKANLRIAEYIGASADGLPSGYVAPPVIINPADANITWNATASRWEVTFNVTGFGSFIVQTNQFALPVNLISFSAQLSGTSVQINWKTADEFNNDHFELERSTDGRTFTSIGRITPLNASGIKNYDWTDANAVSLNTGKIYYRLKIVSVSGSIDYSNTIIVFPDRATKLVTGIMPDPFREQVSIGLNTAASGKIGIMISDMNGRTVLQENRQVPKGFSTQPVNDAGKLSAGVYILAISFEGQSYSYKIIKQD